MKKALFIFILSLVSCTRDTEKEILEHRLNDILLNDIERDIRMDLRMERERLDSLSQMPMLNKLDSLKRQAVAECDRAKDHLIEAQGIYIKLLEDSLCITTTDTL